MNSRLTKFFLAIGLFIVLAGPVEPVNASERYDPACPDRSSTSGEDDWADILNPDGTINWDSLTPAGTVVIGGATFDKYITPDGNVVLIGGLGATATIGMNPEDFTVLDGHGFSMTAQTYSAWALDQAAQFLSDPLGYIQEHFPDLSLEQAIDYLRQLYAAYKNPAEFFDDIRNHNTDSPAWTISPTAAASFWSNTFNSLGNDPRIASSIYYFNGANCDAIPGMCDCSSKTPVPPGSEVCPVATVVSNPISAQVYKIGPTNPVVVGQDPAKRGADVRADVTVPPVVYTWYEPIPVYEDACRTRTARDGVNNCRLNPSDRSYTGISYQRLVRYDCKQHIEILEDRVVSMNVTASLDSASQAWIRGHLASIWYNAHVFQPFWQIIPGIGTLSASCDASKTCFGIGSAFRVPFRDPGNYILALSGRTSGTKVSNPRTFSAGGSLIVKVILVQETWPQ